jgi:hypothetical protein
VTREVADMAEDAAGPGGPGDTGDTGDQRSGPKALVARQVRRAAGVPALEARITALEAELEDYRRAHLRFAELVDVVTELLLPVAAQDPDRARELLERYTDELDQ